MLYKTCRCNVTTAGCIQYILIKVDVHLKPLWTCVWTYGTHTDWPWGCPKNQCCVLWAIIVAMFPLVFKEHFGPLENNAGELGACELEEWHKKPSYLVSFRVVARENLFSYSLARTSWFRLLLVFMLLWHKVSWLMLHIQNVWTGFSMIISWPKAIKWNLFFIQVV